ncbi:MAG: 50S ribosomal protein L25/general stress protein Ctc [Spirochaetia bacterium]
MQQKTLSADARKAEKKSAAKRLRREGKIPAIIYGHHDPVAIAVDASEFDRKFHTISENTIIKISVGKENYDVLVKDYQEDLIKNRILHLDFFEIERGKALKTHVPIHLEGMPVGTKEGGILETLLHEMEVECLPKDLPEVINLDISELQIGDSIHVEDVNPPEGVKYLNYPEQTICSVVTPRAEKTEEELEEEAALAEERLEAPEGEEAAAAEE